MAIWKYCGTPSDFQKINNSREWATAKDLERLEKKKGIVCGCTATTMEEQAAQYQWQESAAGQAALSALDTMAAMV